MDITPETIEKLVISAIEEWQDSTITKYVDFEEFKEKFLRPLILSLFEV